MLFNEKVLCGLGRGIDETGRLHPEGVELATDNLRRFVALARAIPVSRLDVLATAAVRDATMAAPSSARSSAICACARKCCPAPRRAGSRPLA